LDYQKSGPQIIELIEIVLALALTAILSLRLGILIPAR